MFDPNQFDNQPKQIYQSPPLSLSDIENRALIEAMFPDEEPEDSPVLIGIEITPTPKMVFDFCAHQEKLGNEGCGQRFMKGSLNSAKLESSLAVMGNLGLLERSLLRAEVGKKHGNMLAERYLRKAKKIEAREAKKVAKLARMNGRPYRRGELRIKLFSKYKSFRFITILHIVTNLSDGSAVHAVKQMKYYLKEAFSKVFGVSCLGAFEIEVTCRKKMREICDRTKEGRKRELQSLGIDVDRLTNIEECTDAEESRKLSVLESMGGYLNDSLFRDEPSELLVHFHGVVCAPSDAKFNELLKVLRENPMWNKEPRQIVMTSLTTKYGETEKTVEQNLRDIAAYITKGGNDWVSKRPYLRYKIKFSSGTPMTHEEIMSQNWRFNEMLRQNRKEQGGIEDLLSLSVLEINVLAMCIDKMMNLEPNGLGYLFTHGRW